MGSVNENLFNGARYALGNAYKEMNTKNEDFETVTKYDERTGETIFATINNKGIARFYKVVDNSKNGIYDSGEKLKFFYASDGLNTNDSELGDNFGDIKQHESCIDKKDVEIAEDIELAFKEDRRICRVNGKDQYEEVDRYYSSILDLDKSSEIGNIENLCGLIDCVEHQYSTEAEVPPATEKDKAVEELKKDPNKLIITPDGKIIRGSRLNDVFIAKTIDSKRNINVFHPGSIIKCEKAKL